MKRLLASVVIIPLVLLGALQASAGDPGFIEGGHIYQAFPSSNTVAYKFRINDPSTSAIHGVTVQATEPTHGSSTVTICAKDAVPHCTSASTSTQLSSGETLTYESGSLQGASGDIFSGASVGTVTPGFSHIHYVQFTMLRHKPAPAPKPAPVAPTHSAPTQSNPAPVNVSGGGTTVPTHHHRAATTPQQTRQHPANQTATLPPVNVSVPETGQGATETASQTTTPATTTNSSDLGTTGVENPFVALFTTAIGAGAFAYRRSRQRLVDSILR
jgi:hypothetical protein